MVSTRQSSNSSTNTDVSIFVELGKNYEAGPSGTSRRNQQQQAGLSTNAVGMSTGETSSYINLLDFPVEILQKILGYLDYNTIAHLRPVSHQMDKVCGSILNSTFHRLQTQMLSRFQAIKSQMPRRESARRNHPLACESDIIETLHMRLTLLQMSFGKHIERKHCCFFPGEILDEVYRILQYIKVTPKLARPYKVTDELFDLSTMAMEYFKDCIEPTLPEIPYFGAEFLDLAGTFSCKYLRVTFKKIKIINFSFSRTLISGYLKVSKRHLLLSYWLFVTQLLVVACLKNTFHTPVWLTIIVCLLETLRPRITESDGIAATTANKYSLCLDTAPLSVSEGKARGSGGEGSPSRSGNDEPVGSCSNLALDPSVAAPASPPQSNMVLRKRIRKIKQGMKRYNSQLSFMRRDLRHCKAKIAEQQKQIVEYATRLDDNDKKNDETSRKFSTLLQELNKCKTELQYWRSKSPAIPVCLGCGQSIPVPTEDLQALANQGVLSNVEASVNEGLDFIPIADIVVHSPTERETEATLNAQAQQQPQQQQQHQQSSHPQVQTCGSNSGNSCSTSSSSISSSVIEPMAPPAATAPISLPMISSKRKSNSSCLEEEAKKPRRALKSRQAKRSKI